MRLGSLTITEPMTLATDVVLGILALVYGRRLLGLSESPPVRAWGWAFLTLAVGAVAGGVAHGFAAYLGETGRTVTWKVTVYSIGTAVFFMFIGTARAALARRFASWAVALASLKLAAYLAWMTFHNDFVYVIYDYAPTMLAVGVLGGWLAVGLGDPAGWWIAAGVGVSFTGAAVQQSGLSFDENFNYNDLYHVIQMLGLWLFYSGARRLTPYKRAAS